MLPRVSHPVDKLPGCNIRVIQQLNCVVGADKWLGDRTRLNWAKSTRKVKVC